MFKAWMIGLLAGACLFGIALPAFAQPDMVSQKLKDFKSVSQELKDLYAKAKAIDQQIAAATKRQHAAATALNSALQALDPKSKQDKKLGEECNAEMQAARKGIADAELEAHESEALANEAAAEEE